MMTSDLPPLATPRGSYVWVWLPGALEPVVAGRLTLVGTPGDEALAFTYGRSYRDRPDAISLFVPELPLRAGTFDPREPLDPHRDPLLLAGCVRDAAPDAWGRRIINLRVGSNPDIELSELTYLLESGSDRIGGLDFQQPPDRYVPRGGEATLEQLLAVVDLTEAGEPIPSELAAAAGHGTSIGGARPKALLANAERGLVAKFSSSTDNRPVAKAEAVGMLLARHIGLDVPDVSVERVAGKDLLLVDRFDRRADGSRRMLVSALTVLGLSETSARYGSYPMLAHAIIASFAEPARALAELFTRLVLNVCIGNNDDHLRNHAAFWDGHDLTLAPAYDLTPQPRNTQVSTQAIGVTADGGRASQLAVCVAAAPSFRLSPTRAKGIVDAVVEGIRDNWDSAADEARLTSVERDTLMGREILNPYVFYDRP